MRWYLVQEFEKYLSRSLIKDKPIKVAMVGGYSTDPELAALSKISTNLDVTYFGIDSDRPFEYFDINETDLGEFKDEYDFVLCSHVIEHVWNLRNLFLSLEKLTKKGGFLWISCPYSNIPHGSPDFFSTGYTPEFLAKNLNSTTWEFECIESIGSKRNYYATHILGSWLSHDELFRPVTNYEMKPGTVVGNTRKYLLELPGRILLSMVNNRIGNDSRWSTESYVFAKKI